METNEFTHFFKESKHVRYNEVVADMLWDTLKNSKYTKNELAARLGWDEHHLGMVLSGDITINTYHMVHVAGAMGYEFKFKLVKIED